MYKKVILFVSLFFLIHYPLQAQTISESFYPNLALGKVNMAVTTQHPLAKKHFELGLTFLHAFMYELAIQQFQRAQALDPGFAMSYWGEAMANKHSLWNQENVSTAQNILKRYQKNKDNRILSDKEKLFLQATGQLFSNKSLYKRDVDYLNFMAAFYQHYPDDADVGAFFALSLLGMASDFPIEKNNDAMIEKGRAHMTSLFQRFPKHTGVIHYFIHYHDANDINIVKKALSAANIALKLMYSSSHVTHMASHVYRRLGKWDEFIRANQISLQAAETLCQQLANQEKISCDAENKYHALEWLHYGYLKRNQVKKANELVIRMAKIAKENSMTSYKQWYYSIWARQVLSTQNWKTQPIKIVPIAKPDDKLYWSAYAECGALLASGLLATHQQQSPQYQLKRFDEIIHYTDKLADPFIKQTCQIHQLILRADISLRQNNKTAAIKLMNKAIELEKQKKPTELTPSLAFIKPQDL